MKVIEDMNKVVKEDGAEESSDNPISDDDEDNLSFLIEATKICLEKQLPDLVKDNDKFEEALDIPTIWKILEVAAGISLGGPNLRGEAALPGLI
jgi:hypothetical protein